MAKRHNAIFPENYARLLTRAVQVPIVLRDGLKFWLIFYGLSSAELVNEHIRTAMERRGIEPHEYKVTAVVWEAAA
jgi:hypothetical protein